jgi:hypothetical protein
MKHSHTTNCYCSLKNNFLYTYIMALLHIWSNIRDEGKYITPDVIQFVGSGNYLPFPTHSRLLNHLKTRLSQAEFYAGHIIPSHQAIGHHTSAAWPVTQDGGRRIILCSRTREVLGWYLKVRRSINYPVVRGGLGCVKWTLSHRLDVARDKGHLSLSIM